MLLPFPSCCFYFPFLFFEWFGKNLKMPPKKKILLDPNQRTITSLLRSAPTEDIEMTYMPDLSSATPKIEVSELGSQQDVEMHNETDSGQDRTDGTTSETRSFQTRWLTLHPWLIFTGSQWVQMFIVEICVAKIILNTTTFLMFGRSSLISAFTVCHSIHIF